MTEPHAAVRASEPRSRPAASPTALSITCGSGFTASCAHPAAGNAAGGKCRGRFHGLLPERLVALGKRHDRPNILNATNSWDIPTTPTETETQPRRRYTGLAHRITRRNLTPWDMFASGWLRSAGRGRQPEPADAGRSELQ